MRVPPGFAGDFGIARGPVHAANVDVRLVAESTIPLQLEDSSAPGRSVVADLFGPWAAVVARRVAQEWPDFLRLRFFGESAHRALHFPIINIQLRAQILSIFLFAYLFFRISKLAPEILCFEITTNFQ